MTATRVDSAHDVRKLYRACLDAARKLDGLNKQFGADATFHPDALAARHRILDACDRLIFRNPLEYGRQAEDMIWKKCFYDTVQIYRSNKAALSPEQVACAHALLAAAAGYYHSYIMRLQAKFGNDKEKEVKKWCESSVYKCYIYLGDLARYSIDLGDGTLGDPVKLAQLYYCSAARAAPQQGMPYNQLGTLFGGKNHGIDSLSYYFQCLLSEEPFDGAQRNMGLIFAKAEKDPVTTQLDEDVFLVTTVRIVSGALNALSTKNYDWSADDSTVSTFESAWRGAMAKLDQTAPKPGAAVEWNVAAATAVARALLMCIRYVEHRAGPNNTTSGTALAISELIAVQLAVICEHITSKLAPGQQFVVETKSPFHSGSKQKQTGDRAVVVTNGKFEGGPSGDSGVCSPSPLHISQRETPDPVPKSSNTKPSAEIELKQNKPLDKKRVKKRAPVLAQLRRRRRDQDEETEGEDGDSEQSGHGDIESSQESDTEETNGEADVVLLSDSSSSASQPGDQDQDLDHDVADLEQDEQQQEDAGNEHEQLVEGDERYNDNDTPVQLDEEVEVPESSNVMCSLSTEERLQLLSTMDLLPLAKIQCDWLRANSAYAKQSALKLASPLGALCNILPKVNDAEGVDYEQKVKLPEDVQSLIGTENNKHGVVTDGSEQTNLRITSIRSLAHSLCSLAPDALSIDSDSGAFLSALQVHANKVERDKRAKCDLMRSMGRLRVENELTRLSATSWLPAYLVPDLLALLYKLPAVKRLANARKAQGGHNPKTFHGNASGGGSSAFALVVPTAVVNELDTLKKGNTAQGQAARNAIRWLEENVERGVHNVREQRSDELVQADNNDVQDSVASLCSVLCGGKVPNLRKSSTGLPKQHHHPVVASVLTAAVFGSDDFGQIQGAVDRLAGGSEAGVTVENASRFLSRWDRHNKRQGKRNG